MYTIRILAALICLSCLQSVTSYAQSSCQGLFSSVKAEIYLYEANQKISTPESLETVIKMMDTLDRLVSIAQGNEGFHSKIYKTALFELQKTQKLGEKIIKSHAANQDQVFEFFLKAITMVDLANSFVDTVGRQADGYESPRTYSESAFVERFEDLARGLEKNRVIILEKMLPSFIQHEVKNADAPASSLYSSFYYITVPPTDVRIPDGQKFTFQYKFVFKEGLLTLLDLFKDRENGIAYLGVSRKDHADYDGQEGNAKAFLIHDLRHAFINKYFDLILFKEFKAESLRDQVRLKAMTNDLLQKRIQEFQSIKDKNLRDAIEAWYFAFLHEQSKTYPMGVESDLKSKKNIEYYKSAMVQSLKSNRFGEDSKYLLEKPEVLEEAFKWVQKRARADAKELRSNWKARSK